ncbi:MAG: transcription termination/antitermination protein NusG [Ruminococcaceae bacterium]|nr:transcription termination/antitermination protein NusG [Oscillospiraceae bacterium]
MPRESDAKWYVLHTYAGYENNVASNIARIVENRGLQEYIYETQIPLELVSDNPEDLVDEPIDEFEDDFEDEDDEFAEKKKKPAKKKVEEQKLLPSYVLIKMVMNDATRHIVRNIRGVTGFVGPDSQPVPLTDDEIKTLGVGVHKTFSVDYNVGDTVILVSGSMAGNTAIVKEIDPEAGMVKATMLVGGREAVVEFEASAAEIFDV